MTLNQVLKRHVKDHDPTLTDEQVKDVVSGLEFYIEDYLSEQIPEQIENVRDNAKRRNSNG